MRKSLKIDSVEASISFSTDILDIYNLMRSSYPARFIPEYQVREEKKGGNSVYKVEYLRGKPELTFEEKTKKMKICVDKYSYGETSFLLLQLLEREWEENNLYCVHAACVAYDGEGILIVGEGGTGKTSLALDLYKRGFDFLSNEHTVIDPNDNLICGGTKVATVKQYCLDKVEKLREKLIEFPTDDNLTLFLLDLRESPKVAREADISLIVRPIVLPVKKKYAKMSPLSEFYVRDSFLEFSSSLIRGSYVYLNKFSFLGIDLDTPELAAKRCKNLFKKLDFKIPKYTILGNLESIVSKIDDMIGKK